MPIDFLFLSMLSGLKYQLVGSYINSDGMLIEPFYLIPLTYLFLLLSIMIFLIIKGKEMFRSN